MNIKGKLRKTLNSILGIFGLEIVSKNSLSDAESQFVNYYCSQEGEDVVLRRIFESQKTGFYVDIGAHHPIKFSNTYLFYKKGWKGINIEPNIDQMKLFTTIRPGDINLNLGISNKEGEICYYKFEEPALNTFDESMSNQYLNHGHKLLSRKQVLVKRLDEILSEYAVDREIDFMSIDVEQHELSVLESNDWAKFKPKVICIEAGNRNLNSVKNYLTNVGYIYFASTGLSRFFRRPDFLTKYNI